MGGRVAAATTVAASSLLLWVFADLLPSVIRLVIVIILRLLIVVHVLELSLALVL